MVQFNSNPFKFECNNPKKFNECNYCKQSLINKYITCGNCAEVAWCSNKCKRLDSKHNKYCNVLSFKNQCPICEKNKFLEKQDCNHMFCFDCLAKIRYSDICDDKAHTLCPICSQDITSKQLHCIEENYATLSLDYIDNNIESFFSLYINPFYLDAISYMYYVYGEYNKSMFLLDVLSELFPCTKYTIEHNLKLADILHAKNNAHISSRYYLFLHLNDDMYSQSILIHNFVCGYTKKSVNEYKKAIMSNKYEIIAMWITKEHSLFLINHFNKLYETEYNLEIIKLLVNAFLQYCMNMYIFSRIERLGSEFDAAITLTPRMLEFVKMLDANDVHTKFLKASLLILIPEKLVEGGHMLLDLLPKLPDCGLLYARLGLAHLLESHSEKSCSVATRFFKLANDINSNNPNYLKLYAYALFLNCKRRKILTIMLRSQRLFCTVPGCIHDMFYNTLHF